MKHVSVIEPQEWMSDPRTQSVMRALGGYDDEPKALFVGGCVRNSLMDISITDIDIATVHRPDAVMKILLESGIRAIPTGLDHGTVTALVDDKTFEVTTLRKDVETDGRHAVIAFTDKWAEDAERRDFTINTMLASVDGKIFDPTERGFLDLQDRRVVFVGDPAQRIAEDYLRILRFFRFYGRYGVGAPDAGALAACSLHADKISKLSKERITQEFLKIVALGNTGTILGYMRDAGVMSDIFAPLFSVLRMDTMCAFQSRYETPSVIARLALICDFDLDKAMGFLILSNEQKDVFAKIAEAYAQLFESVPSIKKIRAMVYGFGNKVVTQAYLLRRAVDGSNPNLELLDAATYWRAPEFPITGDDLIKAGIQPGRNLGQKLKELEEKWIKSDFKTLPKIQA